MLGLSDVTLMSRVQSLTARELPLAVEGYLVYYISQPHLISLSDPRLWVVSYSFLLNNDGSSGKFTLPVKVSVIVFFDTKSRTSLKLGRVQGNLRRLDHPSKYY